MKLSIRILFGLVVILGLVGFLVSQSEHLPFVRKILVQQSFLASKCLEKVVDSGYASLGDPGFPELSSVVLKLAQKSSEIHVKELMRKQAMSITVSSHGAAKQELVHVTFSDESTAMINLKNLQKEVDDLGKTRLLFWASVLFAVITALQIFLFCLSERKRVSEFGR